MMGQVINMVPEKINMSTWKPFDLNSGSDKMIPAITGPISIPIE
jgi:hypothetical protein